MRMKMKRLMYIVAITGSMFPVAAVAQEGWTLKQCVEYAVNNSLNVKRAENTVEQDAISANTAKWARLPNLNGGAGQSLSWGRAASPVDNSYTDIHTTNTSFSLSTNVPLFTGFELPNQYALAKLNLKASMEDLNKAKDDLSINVASAFVQVLFNQELLGVAEEQLKLSKDQFNRIVELEKLGKAALAEVSEAEARVAQDEVSVVQADNNYRLALLDLSQLLELPSPEGFSLATPDDEPDFQSLTPPDAVFLQAMNSKAEIMAAQYRLEGSRKSVRIAQSAYYPSLSLGAGLGTSFYTSDGKSGQDFFTQLDNNLNKYVSLSLSVPLFNRFATRNQVRRAKLQQSYYSIQLDEAKKTLYKEIQQAWYNALAAEAKYKSSIVAVDANQEAFRLMTAKFEHGKANFVEYNESKLNLMKVVSDKVQAKYEYFFRSKVLDFYNGVPIQ